MNLPLRIVDARSDERLISVDGAWGAVGLNLSHWPGNTTPSELKHDLSTGIALNFARLPQARRAELARGCVAIANNHYDTDGVCSVFAVRHPELALQREEILLEAAAAGDLFRFPSDRALIIDAIVTGLADEERSPWRARWGAASGRERHEWLLEELVAHFAEILDGGYEEFADLWRPVLEAAHADRSDLANAARDDITHLDLCVFTARANARSSRAVPTATSFDPGRHAFFEASLADRVLLIGPTDHGASYRFLLGTASWFDFVTKRPQPRPDLEALAKTLNQLEGLDARHEHAWRAQSSQTPSPELWFGTSEHEMFAEHAPALRPSGLSPAVVRRTIIDALRATWAFPE